MSDFQIIRTLEELEELDPMTLVQPSPSGDCHNEVMPVEALLYAVYMWGLKNRLPAAVIATGEQVRAAREALKEQSKPGHGPCDCVPMLGPVHCHACSDITLKEEPYPGPHCDTNAVEEKEQGNE